MKSTRLKAMVAGLALGGAMLLSGCSAEEMAALDLSQLPEGLIQDNSVTVNIDGSGYTFDTNDPNSVLAAIDAARAQAAGQPAVPDYSYAGAQTIPVGAEYGNAGYYLPEDYASMGLTEQQAMLEQILRANGVTDETAIRVALSAAGDLSPEGGIRFPGLSIIEDIWARNGVTVEDMHRGYQNAVDGFKSIGINVDFVHFDTGFGTIEELCEAVMGDMSSIPGIIQKATGIDVNQLPGWQSEWQPGTGTIEPIDPAQNQGVNPAGGTGTIQPMQPSQEQVPAQEPEGPTITVL